MDLAYRSREEGKRGRKTKSLHFEVQGGGMLMSNNSFQRFMRNIFNVNVIILNKIGTQKKYFQQGIVRLNSNKGIPAEVPFELSYNKTNIRFDLVSESFADKMERQNMRKMFLQGIHPTATVETIVQYFQYFGTVSYAQINPHPLRDGTLCGYLIFESRSTLELIYKQDIHLIDGNRIYVSDYLNNAKTKKPRNLQSHIQKPSSQLPPNLAAHAKISTAGGKPPNYPPAPLLQQTPSSFHSASGLTKCYGAMGSADPIFHQATRRSHEVYIRTPTEIKICERHDESNIRINIMKRF